MCNILILGMPEGKVRGKEVEKNIRDNNESEFPPNQYHTPNYRSKKLKEH